MRHVPDHVDGERALRRLQGTGTCLSDATNGRRRAPPGPASTRPARRRRSAPRARWRRRRGRGCAGPQRRRRPRQAMPRARPGPSRARLAPGATAAIAVRGSEHRRSGVQRPQPREKRLGSRREVRFGQHQPVGQHRLPARFRVPVQRRFAAHRVHQRHDRPQAVGLRHRRVRHQRVEDRRRVRQARGLHDHPGVARDSAGLAPPVQVQQGRRHVASRGAAKASGGKAQQRVVARRHQRVVKRDLAELVHHHRRGVRPRPGRTAGPGAAWSCRRRGSRWRGPRPGSWLRWRRSGDAQPPRQPRFAGADRVPQPA